MTRKSLNQYRKIVGDRIVDKIYEEASVLSEKHILHINSTFQGGGVEEILNSLVLLLNDAGISTGWRVLHGTQKFFVETKKIHNALQGEKTQFKKINKKTYVECNRNFSIFTHLDHDCVIIHDPQPLPLIKFYRKNQPWVWRCHLEISRPNKQLWEYIKSLIQKYDLMIISSESYRKKDLRTPQKVITPSIDPLSNKNKELSDRRITKNLSRFGIDRDKPIITQISRFDKWKDPEGVVKVHKEVKKKIDCKLVLLGSMALDDPEGPGIYERLIKKARDEKDMFLINYESDILVNSLQRVSSVILQKSIREGFGLTVTEALWKSTPVVAGNVGGIPLQIINGKNGYLVDPNDHKGCAKKVIKLLENPKLATEMGKHGKEWVRKNFLITKHLTDWITTVKDVTKNK